MNELEFIDANNRYGLRLSDEHILEIQELCKNHAENETGGILIGYYTEELDCAVVTSVVGNISDSLEGNNWFIRGIRGLQKLINFVWRRHRHYYLGEWHFHPGNIPMPSGIDFQEMENITRTDSYKCPEPILLIIGGYPTVNWQYKAYVFLLNETPIELNLSLKS